MPEACTKIKLAYNCNL